MTDFVLTLSCDDQVGIGHAVARFLAEQGSNTEDSQQYGDRATGRFFRRVHALGDADQLREALQAVAEQFAMTWELSDATVPGRAPVLVSQPADLGPARALIGVPALSAAPGRRRTPILDHP